MVFEAIHGFCFVVLGCCSVDWRTVSGCDACRYRKCLQYFPQPEVAISLNSGEFYVEIQRQVRRVS